MVTGLLVPENISMHQGFTACIRPGRFGRGKKVAVGTVYGALLAVGTTITLAYEGNRIKYPGGKELVPRLE